MKKRILLSLVSFFMMTAMWASLIEAYQIYVTGAAGKTSATATLTLSMKNRNAIGTWECTLVLPTGVTFVDAELSGARYPEGYDGQLLKTVNVDGTVKLICEGEEGVALTNNDGEVATVTVSVAADAPVGDCVVIVKDALLTEPGGNGHNRELKENPWTIEQGEEPGVAGDLTGDGKVDIADAVSVLEIMANGNYDKAADLTGDGEVNIADFVSVLDIMAQQ